MIAPIQTIPMSHKISGNIKPSILKITIVRQTKTTKMRPNCKNCINAPCDYIGLYSSIKKLMPQR